MIGRDKVAPPTLTAVMELNSERVCKELNEPVRKYPRFLPVPDTVVTLNKEVEIREWQNELSIHPELVMIVGRDVVVGEAEKAMDAVLGYSLGIGICDNSLVESCINPTPRDIQVNRWYGYYIDGTRIQDSCIIEAGKFPDIRSISLELKVGRIGSQTFNYGDVMFDGPAVLQEMSKIIPFHRGDVVCLGPVDIPVKVPGDYRFDEEEFITVSGGPFDAMKICVLDRRT